MSTEDRPVRTDLTGQMSIYARAPIVEALIGHEEGRSQRLNTVCERYQAVVSSSCPALSRAEWGVVCDALLGVSSIGIHAGSALDLRTIRLLWAEVSDANTANGLAGKWEVNTDLLVTALREMSLVSKVAVVEVVERFWNQPGGDDVVCLLRQAGARIALDDGPEKSGDDSPFETD